MSAFQGYRFPVRVLFSENFNVVFTVYFLFQSKCGIGFGPDSTKNDFAENYSIIITERFLKEKPSPAIFLFSSKFPANFTKNGGTQRLSQPWGANTQEKCKV